MSADESAPTRPPSPWRLALAFGLVYLSWGTTYLAIKEGVKYLPPALFGGSRVLLAGVLLLGYLRWTGAPLRVRPGELRWLAGTALFLFVGGNYLTSSAQRTVDSGLAAVLGAVTPLWMALLEMAWPRGDRLTFRGWLGIVAGLGGVAVLLAPKLHGPADLGAWGPWQVIAASFAWALGTLLVRHRRRDQPQLVMAAYHMVLGGSELIVLGLVLGEWRQVTPEQFTPAAFAAFGYLLVFGSLVGFLAYTWLLGHVSAAQVGTYAYVNPLIAVLVGWLLGGEPVTATLLGGMGIILCGVALVRRG